MRGTQEDQIDSVEIGFDLRDISQSIAIDAFACVAIGYGEVDVHLWMMVENVYQFLSSIAAGSIYACFDGHLVSFDVYTK